MKEVYVGQDNFTAQIIKSKLEDAGIEACILNENMNNILPYASVIESMALKVVVADDYYQRAMAEIGAVNANRERTECPFCGSTDIEYGLKGKFKAGKILAFLSVAAMSAGIGKFQCNYYCKACESEF